MKYSRHGNGGTYLIQLCMNADLDQVLMFVLNDSMVIHDCLGRFIGHPGVASVAQGMNMFNM